MKTFVSFVGTLPPIKGISDYCLEQVKSLSKEIDIEFFNFSSIYPEFLYPGGETKEIDKTFAIPKLNRVQIRESLAWYNPLSWILVGLTAKGKILHFHWWTYWLFPIFFTIALIAKLRGKKVICTIHNVVSHESGFIDITLSKIIYFIPDKLIVHTNANKNQLEKKFQINKKKISVIPHGIYDFYRDNEISKSSAREVLGIPKNAKVILMFGNIRPYKGIEELIFAFKEAKTKISDLFLIIAGKPWSNELKNFIIRELSNESSCLVKMEYIPSSQIKNYFFATDLVILPYRSFEAQSGPGNIALAFEKPLLVSNARGLPELVLDKKAIFTSGNALELADSIKEIFSKKNLIKKLTSDSIYLRRKYSWESISKMTLNIYNEFGN
ncbi:MAG: glycosyltransferase [Candidatus Pacearchaeota archaeon]